MSDDIENPFGSDKPVEYAPSQEAVPMLVNDIDKKLDAMGQIFSAHTILLYRVYDMLSVIANAVDKDGCKAVMSEHEHGQIVSPPAWFDETQNEVT